MDQSKPSNHNDSVNDAFLHGIGAHGSGVRFLKAGMYDDAISSLLEGIKTINLVRGRHAVVNVDSSPNAQNDLSIQNIFPDNVPVTIDTTPMDSNFEDREFKSGNVDVDRCPHRNLCDLLLAMTYNLALAYHLFAISEDERFYFAALNEALKRYNEAWQELQLHPSAMTSFSPAALEGNICHVQQLLYKKRNVR